MTQRRRFFYADATMLGSIIVAAMFWLCVYANETISDATKKDLWPGVLANPYDWQQLWSGILAITAAIGAVMAVIIQIRFQGQAEARAIESRREVARATLRGSLQAMIRLIETNKTVLESIATTLKAAGPQSSNLQAKPFLLELPHALREWQPDYGLMSLDKVEAVAFCLAKIEQLNPSMEVAFSVNTPGSPQHIALTSTAVAMELLLKDVRKAAAMLDAP